MNAGGRIGLGLMTSLALAWAWAGPARSQTQGRAGGRALARLACAWVGQDGQDRVGPGVGVGPDRLQDARIALTGLAAGVEVRWVRVEGPDGLRWESGMNPRKSANTEFLRDPKLPDRGDLFLAPGRDLARVPLRVTVGYPDDRVESSRLLAGPCDPALAMPALSVPEVVAAPLQVRWAGQDDSRPGLRGAVHLEVTGLPPGSEPTGLTLSNAAGTAWVGGLSETHPPYGKGTMAPMVATKAGDGRVDLHFTPSRDESGSVMMVRADLADGRFAVARFRGGACDLSRIGPIRASGSAEARPGDDLNALAARGGRVVLTPGVYRLDRPLLLVEPIELVGQPGAILEFGQGPGSPRWGTAIEIRAGCTTLQGFSVRFSGPVLWDEGTFYGPAVIGHGLSPKYPEYRVNLRIEGLDLEGPPVARPSRTKTEPAPKLIRLPAAVSGRIAGNRLRGGAVEFFGGPWEIVDNTYTGTPPGSACFEVFVGHGTRGLVLKGNRVKPVAPHGKTWRFLVLTNSGAGDLVAENTVEGIGPRDDDTIPGINAAELILTEAYRLSFEGRPAAVSADGYVVRVAGRQGEPAGAGAVLAVLTGPSAGTWIRLAQAVDADTFLLDAPLPDPKAVISVASGFVGERFERNRLDTRGSREANNLVLVGNHFGTIIRDNQFLGGGDALKVTAAPTELPVHWGWSHAPAFGLEFRGNTIEQPARPGFFSVEHSPAIKSNAGRLYMTLDLRDNRLGKPAKGPGPTLWLGEGPPPDPDELRVTAAGNTALDGSAFEPVRVRSGTVNGRPTTPTPDTRRPSRRPVSD
ncbi:hypothetical protein EP7_002468 [Isosphaeraceae bacterium EP7]